MTSGEQLEQEFDQLHDFVRGTFGGGRDKMVEVTEVLGYPKANEQRLHLCWGPRSLGYSVLQGYTHQGRQYYEGWQSFVHRTLDGLKVSALFAPDATGRLKELQKVPVGTHSGAILAHSVLQATDAVLLAVSGRRPAVLMRPAVWPEFRYQSSTEPASTPE